MEGVSQGAEAVTERGDGAFRGPDGRFLPGNPGGPGNPRAAQVAELRRALLEAVTPDDVRGIVAGLVERAKHGDHHATLAVLDRLFGKVSEDWFPDAPNPVPDELARLRAARDELEAERERLKAEREIITTRWRALLDRLAVEQKKAALGAAERAVEKGKPIPPDAADVLKERAGGLADFFG